MIRLRGTAKYELGFGWNLPNGLTQFWSEPTERHCTLWHRCTKGHALLQQRCTEHKALLRRTSIEHAHPPSAEEYWTHQPSFGWYLPNPSLVMSLSLTHLEFVLQYFVQSGVAKRWHHCHLRPKTSTIRDIFPNLNLHNLLHFYGRNHWSCTWLCFYQCYSRVTFL